MSSTIVNSFDCDAEYDWEESVNTNAIVHDEHDKDGYHEDDDGEYVVERKTKKKEPSSENNKPKHQKSEAGIYDEVNYTLSPRNDLARTDEIVVNDIDNKDSWYKQHKVIIILIIINSVLAVFLVTAVVVGIVVATQDSSKSNIMTKATMSTSTRTNIFKTGRPMIATPAKDSSPSKTTMTTVPTTTTTTTTTTLILLTTTSKTTTTTIVPTATSTTKTKALPTSTSMTTTTTMTATVKNEDIIIQRHVKGYGWGFAKNWTDYKNGFGSTKGNFFWLGLERMHELTASGSCELEIKIKFTVRYSQSNQTKIKSETLKWKNFSVGSESTNYRLSVSGFDKGSSWIGDRLQDHNGMKFCTRDRLHCSCTRVNGDAGWWYLYGGCWQCHLNWGKSGGPQYNGYNDESTMILKLK